MSTRYNTASPLKGGVKDWLPPPLIVPPVVTAPVVYQSYPAYYARPYYAPYYAPIGLSLNFGYSRGYGGHHWR